MKVNANFGPLMERRDYGGNQLEKKEKNGEEIDYSKYLTEAEYKDIMDIIRKESEKNHGYFAQPFMGTRPRYKVLTKEAIPILLENRDSIQIFTIHKKKLKVKSKFYSYSKIFTDYAPNGDTNICFTLLFDKINQDLNKNAFSEKMVKEVLEDNSFLKIL